MAKRHIEQHRPVADFPTANPKEFENVILSPDVAAFKQKIEQQYFTPYNLSTPGHVLKCLVMAHNASGPEKSEFLEKARQKAEVHFLASWAKGHIKVKDEDAKPMSEQTKVELREIKLQRKMEKQQLEKVDAKPKNRLPVWSDKSAQATHVANYAWIIVGTFRQDPENQNKTIVDINCQTCKSTRTVHLADVFQTKYCLKCRGKNAKSNTKPIVDKQSNSGPDSSCRSNSISVGKSDGTTNSGVNGRSVGSPKLQPVRPATPGNHRQVNQQGTRSPTRSKI